MFRLVRRFRETLAGQLFKASDAVDGHYLDRVWERTAKLPAGQDQMPSDRMDHFLDWLQDRFARAAWFVRPEEQIEEIPLSVLFEEAKRELEEIRRGELLREARETFDAIHLPVPVNELFDGARQIEVPMQPWEDLGDAVERANERVREGACDGNCEDCPIAQWQADYPDFADLLDERDAEMVLDQGDAEPEVIVIDLTDADLIADIDTMDRLAESVMDAVIAAWENEGGSH